MTNSLRKKNRAGRLVGRREKEESKRKRKAPRMGHGDRVDDWRASKSEKTNATGGDDKLDASKALPNRIGESRFSSKKSVADRRVPLR